MNFRPSKLDFRIKLVRRLVLLMTLTIFASLSTAQDPKPSRERKPSPTKPIARPTAEGSYDPVTTVKKQISKMKVGPKDWPQWGGTPERNNTPIDAKVPTSWDVSDGTNILWSSALGSESRGNPVVANGKVYVGTNNEAGYLKRYPPNVDLGVLLCFDEKDGKFLWQYSSEKLASGRENDWSNQGICSTPMIDGDRGWFVTNRGEVVCFDTEGFRDKENDGPYKSEVSEAELEADTIWKLDMMTKLKVRRANMCNCSVTGIGNFLFVCTGHGIPWGAANLIPETDAPSFICLNRDTGDILWTDHSPGENVLCGQWSSPCYGVFDGQAQVIFAGGDGWLYSFKPEGDENGNSSLLWKFDCNPKDSVYSFNRGTRNYLVATPVIHDGLIYIGVGSNPEDGDGNGHLWCIDPTKRGDVSPTQVFNGSAPDKPIPHKRRQALNAKDGDFERVNLNSAAVWHYVGKDPNVAEQAMHRTISTAAIKNNLLIACDLFGIVHCVDSKSGTSHWTYDVDAEMWASPLIVNDLIYVFDQDGDITIFRLATELDVVAEIRVDTPKNVKSQGDATPIVANDTLFIVMNNRLFAMKQGAKTKLAQPKK